MKLLCVSTNDRDQVRSKLNLCEDSIKRDVDMVQEWYAQEPHMPEVPLDRDFVERMLIYTKGSVEQTKRKINLLYTLKAVMPEMASPRDILHPDIQNILQAFTFAAMPRMNDDLTRVHVHRLSNNYGAFVLADTFKYIFMIIEYRMKHDYVLGERYIYDLQHMTVGHVTRVNPIALKKGEILLKAYGGRVFGFHFINASSSMNMIMNMLKGAMSEKLFGRITIHPTVEDLHKYLNKSILPKEYGGDDKTLDELANDWKHELNREDTRHYLLHQEQLKSNEALRIHPRPSDDMLGIPGSFKKIDVE